MADELKNKYYIEILCTCYTLDYLIMHAEALKSGVVLEQIGGEIGIFELLPYLTLEELNEAISCYEDEKYKTIREHWLTKSDREYDIQTLCICYSLADLNSRRDELLNGINTPVDESDKNGVLYTAEADVLDEAIAHYNEEKYQRIRSKMAEEWKQYGIR